MSTSNIVSQEQVSLMACVCRRGSRGPEGQSSRSLVQDCLVEVTFSLVCRQFLHDVPEDSEVDVLLGEGFDVGGFFSQDVAGYAFLLGLGGAPAPRRAPDPGRWPSLRTWPQERGP